MGTGTIFVILMLGLFALAALGYMTNMK